MRSPHWSCEEKKNQGTTADVSHPLQLPPGGEGRVDYSPASVLNVLFPAQHAVGAPKRYP